MNRRFLITVIYLLGMATAWPVLADNYGPVLRGQDLWDIARRVYPGEDVSRDQVMLALLKANPQAFDMPCNANSPLKIGATLQIPSLTRVRALDREQANQEFERQLREWEDHRVSGEALVCPPEIQTAAVAPGQATVASGKALTPETAPASQVTPPVSKPAASTGTPGTSIQPATPAAPLMTPRGAIPKPSIARSVRYEEWLGIPILALLLIGIMVRTYRRRPAPVAAPVSVAAVPAERADDHDQVGVEETLAQLGVDRDRGLSAEEAAKRLQTVGPNALEEKQVTLLQRILPYFWGPIPWMIETAAVLSLLTRDWNDFAVITALLVFNAAIGFREEASDARDRGHEDRLPPLGRCRSPFEPRGHIGTHSPPPQSGVHSHSPLTRPLHAHTEGLHCADATHWYPGAQAHSLPTRQPAGLGPWHVVEHGDAPIHTASQSVTHCSVQATVQHEAWVSQKLPISNTSHPGLSGIPASQARWVHMRVDWHGAPSHSAAMLHGSLHRFEQKGKIART